jgi:hypothetical protein
MHPNARRQHETLDQYHSRLKAERKDLKARLQGTRIWNSARPYPGRFNTGLGTYRKGEAQ